ncbi:MAG TPA: hypothetical protein VHA30_03220 [Patescibacteria group bacterium]|nr:hypothetical protein [Patescibacteria group bacterium]
MAETGSKLDIEKLTPQQRAELLHALEKEKDRAEMTPAVRPEDRGRAEQPAIVLPDAPAAASLPRQEQSGEPLAAVPAADGPGADELVSTLEDKQLVGRGGEPLANLRELMEKLQQ